jgi:hypothetical protein
MSFYPPDDWEPYEPERRPVKRLAEILPADERPAGSVLVVHPLNTFEYKIFMGVPSLGGLIASAKSDPETGRMELTGLALTSHECPPEER